MSEWWTYRPSSFLLFSARTYYRLLASYNAELWPLQWVIAGAIAAALLASPLLRRVPALPRDRLVCVALVAAWSWVAWGWEHLQFATINWAADHVAVLFALQALALGWHGVVRGRVAFARDDTGMPWLAWSLVGVGLIGYPLLAPMLGRPWSQVELFGLMPEPTAIASLGLLLRARPLPRSLLVVPVVACLYAGLLLWAMRAPEALLPPVAAIAAIAAAWVHSRRQRRAPVRGARPGARRRPR